MSLVLIYGIFFFAFFGNSLVGYNLMPAEITIATEIFIFLLFVNSIFSKKASSYLVPLAPIFLFLVIIALCSSLANATMNINMVSSMRLIIRFYIFYLAIINLNLDDRTLKHINGLLFFIFFLQLLVSAIKFSYFGVSELTMGSYAVRGGGLTTAIPIIALGYLYGFYVLHRPRKIYLLLAVGFILYGIVGAKKALFFIYPVAFIGLYFLIYVKNRGVNILRDIFLMGLLVMISIFVLVVQMKYLPELNKDKGGGKVDWSYSLDYLSNYTNMSDPTASGLMSGHTAIGRSATTRLIFNELARAGIVKIFFGFSPGTLTKSVLSDTKTFNRSVRKIQMSYGVTGLTFVLTEYGVFGLLCILSMFIYFSYRSWQWYQRENDPYWRAFAAGTFVFVIFDFFLFIVYNSYVIVDDTLTPTFYYVMAVMFIKSRQLLPKTTIN